MMGDGQRFRSQAYLKVDMAVGQAVSASFIKEVDVFNQQTEEWNHDLEREPEDENDWIQRRTMGRLKERRGPTFSLLLFAVRERWAAPRRAVL